MPNPPNQELDTALQAYLAALPRQARLIRLAGEVLRQVGAVQAGLPSAPGLAAPEAEARLRAGEPVQAHLPISTPVFKNTLGRLLELCQQFELLPPLSPDVLQALLSLPPPAWLADNLRLTDICPDREIPAGLFHFLGQKALSPFYQRAAAPYAPLFLQGTWQQGNCPNCAQRPALASLAPESGQKLLYCSLCAVQWPFPRRTCVFCGHEEPHFSYLFVEDDPTRRADLCQACHGYLKTIVTNKLTHPLSLPLEEFVTVDLDILVHRADLFP
jgi:FdhE protein